MFYALATQYQTHQRCTACPPMRYPDQADGVDVHEGCIASAVLSVSVHRLVGRNTDTLEQPPNAFALPINNASWSQQRALNVG